MRAALLKDFYLLIITSDLAGKLPKRKGGAGKRRAEVPGKDLKKIYRKKELRASDKSSPGTLGAA